MKNERLVKLGAPGDKVNIKNFSLPTALAGTSFADCDRFSLIRLTVPRMGRRWMPRWIIDIFFCGYPLCVYYGLNTTRVDYMPSLSPVTGKSLTRLSIALFFLRLIKLFQNVVYWPALEYYFSYICTNRSKGLKIVFIQHSISNRKK